MKAPPLADDVKMEVKRFHDRISASTESHPVNFDDVWALAGYSRKDSAKRALPKAEAAQRAGAGPRHRRRNYSPHICGGFSGRLS